MKTAMIPVLCCFVATPAIAGGFFAGQAAGYRAGQTHSAGPHSGAPVVKPGQPLNLGIQGRNDGSLGGSGYSGGNPHAGG